MHMPPLLTKSITADDLLAMGDIGRCELMYGELVMMSPSGAEHGIVALRIGAFLREFVEREDLGEVFAAETGFVLDRNPDLVRAPDASFVCKSRLSGGIPRGYFEGAPDLAVEVNSPGDTRREIAEKINLWLARGATAVWEIDSQIMTVSIHRIGQKTERLTATQELRDQQPLPGFVLPLKKLFKLP